LKSSALKQAANKPARRRPQQKRSIEKVEKILDAARKILENEGPSAFNTNLIAERAGISVGTLYEYFQNKEAIASRLNEELAAAESDIIMEMFRETEDTSLEDSIANIVSLTFELYRENGAMYRALAAISTHNRKFVGTRKSEKLIMDAIASKLEKSLTRIKISDIETATFVIFHSVESLAYFSVSPGGSNGAKSEMPSEVSKVVTRYLGIE